MSPTVKRIRTRMASGVVILVPLVITIYVLRALFSFTAGILLPVIDPAFADWPLFWRTTLSLAVLVVVIYVIGEIATHVVGRRVLEFVEGLLLRVPIVKVIYRISKQVAATFNRPNSRAFKEVVLVQFPGPGLTAVGFLTGTIPRGDGSRWNTVFVPTTPNPTTGFLQLIPESEVTRTDFTVEDAFKMIMSLGALNPGRFPSTGSPSVQVPEADIHR